MRIIRTSRLTGNTTHWDMPITQAQLDAWVDGELIGGCDIIAEMETSGELAEIIKSGGSSDPD